MLGRPMCVVAIATAHVCAQPTRVFAQPSAAIEANRHFDEGIKLAATNDYEAAIAAFRRADTAMQRPIHACNIGLAYVRLSLWQSAHYYLIRCRGTWKGDNLPNWVERRIGESASALAAGDFTRVTIETAPAKAAVRIDPFPGEVLYTNQLWLSFGTHRITVGAEGHETQTQQLVIARRSPRTISVALEPKVPEAERPRPTESSTAQETTSIATDTTTRSRSTSWMVASSVSIGLVAATTVSAIVARGVANDGHADALSASNDIEYDDAKTRINTGNTLFITSVVLGGAAVAASAYCLYRWLGSNDAPIVSAQVGDAGGSVQLGWRY